MNYGRDDLEILTHIRKEVTVQEHKDYLDKILSDWDGYLNLIDMIDNRIAKIEGYHKQDTVHFEKIRLENDRLRKINTELINLISKIGGM